MAASWGSKAFDHNLTTSIPQQAMNAQQKDRAIVALIADRLNAYPANDDHLGRTLRRAQLTLHRWAEEMCNGTIQRDGEEGDGKPFRHWPEAPTLHKYVPVPVPDRERGALARVAKVCKDAGLYYYHQTDPRGCALYVGAEPLTHDNYNTKGVPCI